MRPPQAARPVLGIVAWLGFLVVVTLAGPGLGRGPLAPPPLTEPGSWAAWASGRTPLEASFAVLGLVVVLIAWYLLAVTTFAVVARLWGAGRLVSVVDVLTLPVVRRSLHAALGFGLVGTSVAGGAAAVAVDRRTPAVAIVASPVVAVGVAEPAGEPDQTPDDAADQADPPVMRLLPDEPPDEASDADAGLVTPASPTGEGTEAEWEVRPGDHLWSVAARVLQDAGVTVDGESEVAHYWLRLIEANAGRLADPANPDLIYPGQLLVLPIPSPPGDRALP